MGSGDSSKLDRSLPPLIRRVSRARIMAVAASSSSSSSSKLLFSRVSAVSTALILILLTALILITAATTGGARSVTTALGGAHRSLLASAFHYSRGGAAWERQVRGSAVPRRRGGMSVLVTGAAGFIGTHCSLALRRRGDGVVGLDNFNAYYDPALKRDRASMLARRGVLVVDGDINDGILLAKLFHAVAFTHVLHLAAQAGVRYAMKNPQSYVTSNIAGLVNLLETAAKSAEPQPAIVWASSSSVYGLNTDSPFSELHRTDKPASLYAATKKAGEEIAYTYNHIYGLSITGLRFFTVYGPWGRPDMAYFSFTNDILNGRPITVFQTQEGQEVARDFTYVDDIVSGCLGALDTAEKSTGSGGKKKRPAQLRVYNLGNTLPVPVGKLVGILERLLGVKAERNVVTMPRNGDVPFTHANVSLAARDLRYRPTTDLETGLRKFVQWYAAYYGIKSPVKYVEESTLAV